MAKIIQKSTEKQKSTKDVFETENCYCQAVETEALFGRNFVIYEFNSDRDKTSLLNDYVEKIKPYLMNFIGSLKVSGEWQTQLSV